MKRIKSVFVGIAAVILFFVACKKIDVTDIGGDLLPAVDNVNTFDTVLDIVTDLSFLADSSRILRDEPHAWGVIDNDADFGKTKAEFNFLVTPGSYGVHPFAKKDSILIFDSVVLALTYRSQFGDSNSLERMLVYEIDNDGFFDNTLVGYKIDTPELRVVQPALGGALIDFKKLDDSVYDIRKRDTLRTVNQVRVQLDKNLATRFLNYDTLNAYKSDSNFRNYFKGLSIKVDEAQSPVKNGLAYFTLNTDNTKLIFYYRVKSPLSGAIVDTVATEFGFYTFTSTNSNPIKRTPAGPYQASLSNPATNEEKLYLQSSPGSVANIRIPGLKNLSNRVIHRAELIFDVLPSNEEEKYRQPQILFLDVIDTANSRYMTVPYDFSYDVQFTSTFGGLPYNGQYRFNVSRYVQSVITRKESDFTLRLYAPFRTNSVEKRGTSILIPSLAGSLSGYPMNTPIAAGRVVVSGGAHPDPAKKARLRVVYSKI